MTKQELSNTIYAANAAGAVVIPREVADQLAARILAMVKPDTLPSAEIYPVPIDARARPTAGCTDVEA